MTTPEQELIVTLSTAFNTAEAGRRVGWAKYYDELGRLEREKHQTFHRVGMIAGFLRLCVTSRVTKIQMAKAIYAFVDQMLIDPFDRAAYEQGKQDVVPWITERYGTPKRAVRHLASLPLDKQRRRRNRNARSGKVRMLEGQEHVEARCLACNKLIGILEDEFLETKCFRCGCFNELDLHQEEDDRPEESSSEEVVS